METIKEIRNSWKREFRNSIKTKLNTLKYFLDQMENKEDEYAEVHKEQIFIYEQTLKIIDQTIGIVNNKYEDLEIEFYKENPIEITKMICNVDSRADPICVWDIGKPEDCFLAGKGIKKANCRYWVEKTITNDYTAKDVFDWLKNREK